MTKTVCVVGAGPSGLVATKNLLHDVPNPGTFKVTIYDAQPRIGGLWPTRKDDIAGLVHPLMVANQSKHTVQFSDLAWRPSDPQVPKAWQVGRYLERYLEEYVAGPGSKGDAVLRLGHRVVATELLEDNGSWKVRTESDQGTAETNIYDYLLVATGFFGKPMWPESLPGEGRDVEEVPVIHSSKYRDIESLLGAKLSKSSSGGKILVVGGQMSGIEIAGTVATHLSSIVNSPGEKTIKDAENYSIHHVVQRPAWVFPLFTSPKAGEPAPPFLPVDVSSYNLAVRPHPLKNSQGHISVETARTSNSIYQNVLGTNQSEFSAETQLDGDKLGERPFVAMSSPYMDFVRSGLIKVHIGKFSALSGTTAHISSSSSVSTQSSITDIAAVILATGFDPAPSLSFLPSAVLQTISHSPSHPNLPLALAFHGTHHPSLPTLGFVGFYRSPYWGVMEMQARLLTRLWTSKDSSEHAPALREALENDDSIGRTLGLRSDPRVSQFPMGDYAFLMQEFGRALDIPISKPIGTAPPLANDQGMDILTPARYLPPTATEAQKAHAIINLTSTHETVLAALGGGRFVAQAVFRSLLGEWRLEREIRSRLPSHPSGKFVGTARFLLREGTPDGRETSSSGDNRTNGENDADEDLGLEYLYVEDGDFTAAENGMKFRATRRYVWRYDEGRDKLSVWFARTDDNTRADYLFHEVEFLVPSSSPPPTPADEGEKEGGGWKAKASHLCVEDWYDVHYEFLFKAVNLREWRLGYSVKGPKKDYTIKGVFRR